MNYLRNRDYRKWVMALIIAVVLVGVAMVIAAGWWGYEEWTALSRNDRGDDRLRRFWCLRHLVALGCVRGIGTRPSATMLAAFP
jgi:hypothetical protein